MLWLTVPSAAVDSVTLAAVSVAPDDSSSVDAATCDDACASAEASARTCSMVWDRCSAIRTNAWPKLSLADRGTTVTVRSPSAICEATLAMSAR